MLEILENEQSNQKYDENDVQNSLRISVNKEVPKMSFIKIQAICNFKDKTKKNIMFSKSFKSRKTIRLDSKNLKNLLNH